MFNGKKIKELEYQVVSLTDQVEDMRQILWETSEKLYALADATGYAQQKLPAKVMFVKKEQGNV